MTRSLSAREKIDDDAEHYCAIHSPPRRKKMLQDKVKTGIEKINSLKQIEQNKDMTAKYVNETKQKPQVRLQRSASERVSNRNSSSFLMKREGRQQQRISNEVAVGNLSLGKKVTFNSAENEEQKRSSRDSLVKTVPDIKHTSPSPSTTRSSVTLPK